MTGKKQPGKRPEKRIYVIVPETVQVTQRGGKVVTRRMESGRLMAQCAHVVTRLRLYPDINARFENKPVTTIVLSVRNSRELSKVTRGLMEVCATFTFDDTNPPFYGTRKGVHTATAIGPLVKTPEIDAVIDHLELYR